MKLLTVLIICVFSLSACAEKSSTAANQTENVSASGGRAENGSDAANENSSDINQTSDADKSEAGQAQTSGPRTVREFFMLLPEKYFVLEGCDRARDKDCRKARIDYLKTFAEIEDTKNGYLKGGCDGAQACLEMALFKRPDSSYLVGVATSAEMMNDYYFLDYKNGKWTDVSAEVVPEFSKKNMYELPRYGTRVKVFAKKIIEEGNNEGDKYEISEKGAHLYDLEWKDGRFVKRK